MNDQKRTQQYDASSGESPKEKKRRESKRRQRLLEFLGACEVIEVIDTGEDTVAIEEVEAVAADIVYNGAQGDSPAKEQNNN